MLPKNPPESVEPTPNDTMEIDTTTNNIPKEVPTIEIKTEFDELQSNLSNIIKSLDAIELESSSNVPPESSHDDDLESLPECDPELDGNEYSGRSSASIDQHVEIVYISEKKYSNSISSLDDSELKPPLIIDITPKKDGDVIQRDKSPEVVQEEKPVIQATDTVVEAVIPKPRERKSKLFNKNDIPTIEKSDKPPKKDARQSESPVKQPDPPTVAINSSDKTKKDYPDDLNPFGDDDDNGQNIGAGKNLTKETKPKTDSKSKATVRIEYPDDLNPFGDDENENDNSKLNTTSSSLNPFGSESEDENGTVSKNLSVTPPSRRSTNQQSTPSSTPTKRKKKKGPAPLPPNKSNQSLNKLDQTETNNSIVFDSNISNTSSMVDLSGSMEQLQQSSRTPTPTPRRSKMNKSTSSTNLVHDPESSTSSSSNSVQAQLKAIKSKKRPAPPIPALKRSLKTAPEDMDKELEAIGDELPSVEQERSELEKWLLEHKNSETESADKDDDFEPKLERFLELAKQKCKLGRRQKELMYMKRELKLEETQLEFEYQLRKIMSKQDTQKTDEDRREEQRLLGKMMEIIDERNDIIENMVQDENKEIEEYQRMISQVVLEKSPVIEHSNQTNSGGGETVSAEKSSKTLKPFSRLKKLNKKFQAKIKSQQFDNDTMEKAENHTLEDDKSSTNSEDAGRTGDDGSPTPNDSTKMNGNDMKNKSKKKDLATLGRSTLKKLAHPTKTLQTVSKEIKSKFNQQSQLNGQQQQQQQSLPDRSSPSPVPDASSTSTNSSNEITVPNQPDDKPVDQ